MSYSKPLKLVSEELLDVTHYAPIVSTIHQYIHREKDLMCGWLDVRETSFTEERYLIDEIAK